VKAYTVASLAAEWQCSEGTIRNAIADGELGCFRLGTLIRIPAEEVRRFECQNIPSSGSEADSPSSGATKESEGGSRSTLPIAPQRKRRRGLGGHERPTPQRQGNYIDDSLSL
jgi:excisionase family DNA binding protein